MRATVALVLLAAALACAAAPTARADGDPASDYLLTQKVFFPFDLKVPNAQQQQFIALVDEANRKGFPIRVALIASPYDLGSITSLWRKPRTYARFLGAELRYVYKDRLLIVMPNGFGFNRQGHPTRAEYRTLSQIPVSQGADRVSSRRPPPRFAPWRSHRASSCRERRASSRRRAITTGS